MGATHRPPRSQNGGSRASSHHAADLHSAPGDTRHPDALKVVTRLDADALDHLAALAHDDALLTLALNIHGRHAGAAGRAWGAQTRRT